MTQGSGQSVDFLLSYKESDRAWAELISHMLTEAGYSVEMFSWTYKASRSILADVERMGHEGAIFAPVLTPAYMTTINSEHYWFEAFREGRFPVLPIWARECDIEKLLYVHEYVDIRDCTVDQARERILPMALKLKGEPQRREAVAPARPVVDRGARIADLAPVRRVPFERAEPFTGGESLLASMLAIVNADGVCAILPHESRLGGYGRRKACIEYLYRHESGYRLIWVVRAANEAVLAEDYAQLASVVKLPEASSRDLPFVVQAVRRWLSNSSQWLLLFHDPPSHAALQNYLPAPGRGHVLISANKPSWPEVRGVLHVTPWTHELTEQHFQAVLHPSHPDVLGRLAVELHGYPIAAAFAARFAREMGWPADALLERYTARDTELNAACSHMPPQRRALAVTISLALSELWRAHPVCVDLLRVFAYLDSYNILPGMLVSGATTLSGPLAKLLRDHQSTEDAIQLLRRMGIIEERFGSITFHSLIQAQLREWMEQQPGSPIHEVHPQLSHARSFSLARAEGPLWARRVIQVLLEIFPESSHFDSKARQASKVISHSRAALEHAARLGIERADCVELWSRLGEFLLYRDLLDPAREALERAVKLDTLPQVGASERRYAMFKALGQVCAYDNCPSEAIAHFEQGLRLAERRFGKKHSRVSEMHILLGNARRKTGDFEGALDSYMRAHEIDMALHSVPHEDTMRDLMLMGITRQAMGDQSTAWSDLSDALTMQQTVYGPGHITLARVSRCLAELNQEMGDTNSALANLKIAIEVTERNLGNGHPSLADDYMDYGDLLMASNEINDARRAYKSAFKILQALHGDGCLELLPCALKLGDSAMARKEADKALPAYELAASILRHHPGSDAAKQGRMIEEKLAAARSACQAAAS